MWSKHTVHINSISKISIFKSEIVQLKSDDKFVDFVDLMNCDDESIILID